MIFIERFLAIMGVIFIARTFIYGFLMTRMKQGKCDQVRCGACGHIHKRKEE